MSQFIEMFGGIQNDSKWPLKSLEELCDMVNGYAFKSNKYSDAGYSIIRIANVQKGTIDDSDKVYYPEQYRGEYSDSILKEGDILVSLTGNVGRVGVIYNKHLPAALNQRVQGLRIKNTSLLNPQYLFSLLNLDDFENLCIKNASGSAQLNLSTVWLRNCKIVCPPIEKQEQFALIAQQADKSKFVGFKSQFIEMFGSGHWEQKCLGEVGTFKRGGGFQKSDYVECGIPCIHYGQIHTKFGPFIYSHISEISSDLECKTKFASKGDLIIAITSEDTEGSCKSTAWLGDYPVAVGGHAAIFHHSMNPVYMSFFFKSVLFNHAKMEYIHGTKVCEIKPDDIAKILVPYPPMSLQEEFSSIAQQADKSKLVLLQIVKSLNYNIN